MEETVTPIQPISDQEEKRHVLVAALVDFITAAIRTETKDLRDELRDEIREDLREAISDNVYKLFHEGDFKSEIRDGVQDILETGMVRDEITNMIRDGDISIDVDVDASLSV